MINVLTKPGKRQEVKLSFVLTEVSLSKNLLLLLLLL